MTFASFVDLGLSRAQERGQEALFTFLRDNGTEASSMTFGQLDQRARAIGAALHEHGAQQRPVLVLLPPGPQYANAIIGDALDS